MVAALVAFWGYLDRSTPPEDALQVVHRTVRWAGLHRVTPLRVHYLSYHPRTGEAYLRLTCVDARGEVHYLQMVCPPGEPCSPKGP